MIEVLRTARGRLVEIKLFYSILFTFGQLRLTILICFIFMIFFLSFVFLARCFSCILPIYLGCAFCTFTDILIIYQKSM